MWMSRKWLDRSIRASRSRVVRIASISAILGGGAAAAYGPLLRTIYAHDVAAAGRLGWDIRSAGPLVAGWRGLTVPTSTLQHGPLRVEMGQALFRLGLRGGTLTSAGPHQMVWADTTAIALAGVVTITIGSSIAVEADSIRQEQSGGAAFSLRWAPATVPGTIVVSNDNPHLQTAGNSGPAQAAAAVLAVLGGPGGRTATLAVTRAAGALTIAGFPVLPWPDSAKP